MRLTTLNRYLIEKFRPERDFDPVLSLIISVVRSDLVVQPFGPSLNSGSPSMSSQLPSTAKCTDMVGFHHSLSPIEQATAIRKAGAPEHNLNTRYPQRALLAYTADSYWRKRNRFDSDQPEVVTVLIRNWTKELGGGLIKGLWARSGAKITGRFVMRLYRRSHRPRRSLSPLHDAITGNDRN